MDDDEFKRVVLERFDALGGRLDALAERLDGVDRRFDAVDRRLNAIVARLDQQDEAHDALYGKVDRLQKSVISLAETVEQSLGHLTNLSRRVTRLENPDG